MVVIWSTSSRLTLICSLSLPSVWVSVCRLSPRLTLCAEWATRSLTSQSDFGLRPRLARGSKSRAEADEQDARTHERTHASRVGSLASQELLVLLHIAITTMNYIRE